jgi:hypothetical protein
MDDLGQFLEFLFEILFAYFAICQTKYLNFLPCRKVDWSFLHYRSCFLMRRLLFLFAIWQRLYTIGGYKYQGIIWLICTMPPSTIITERTCNQMYIITFWRKWVEGLDLIAWCLGWSATRSSDLIKIAQAVEELFANAKLNLCKNIANIHLWKNWYFLWITW